MGRFRKYLHYLKLEAKCLSGAKEKHNIDVKEHNCWILGTTDHRNMGDQAITYATTAYVKTVLPDYNIIEVTEGDIYQHICRIKKCIGKNDIIILQGGGNLGNVYDYIEDIRRIVLKKIKNVPVIIFPQTVYFTEDDDGCIETEISKKIYNKHKNLTVFTRELASYNKVKTLFNAPSFCVPDIVLSLKQTTPLKQNDGRNNSVMLCLRNDREGILNNSDKEYIEKCISDCGFNITKTDTIAELNVGPDNREIELKKLFERFADVGLVITDRLHGMIFAVLVNTPCIVLSNYNHKVCGVYDWIKDFDNIKFLKDKSELTVDLIKEYANKSTDNEQRWQSLAERFAPLKTVLREKSHNG